MAIGVKIYLKISANLNQHRKKEKQKQKQKLLQYKWAFIPNTILKSINEIYIKKRKDTNHVISIDAAKKQFEKIHIHSWWKDSVLEENFLNLIKDIYEKPTSSIMLNGEISRTFSLKLGIR